MDLSAFDNEGLVSILASMGVEDIEHLSREEMEQLVRSLNGTDSSMEVDASPVDLTESTSEDVNVAFMEDADAINHVELVDNTAAEDVAANAGPVVPTAEQEAMITEFIMVSGAEVDVARTVLESMGWDLQNALTLFLDDAPLPPAPAPTIQPVATPMPIHPAAVDAGVMHTMPYGPGAIHPMEDLMQHIHRMGGHGVDHGGEDDEMDSPPRYDRYDDEGVRVPDPVRLQRLVNTRSTSDNMDEMAAFARAEDPGVEWLFAPPRHLSSMLSLDKTREQASKEKRWLLVNLQSHDEFTSHLLNRDVWADETIESLLRGDYLFWQRGHTSVQGRDYMRLYRTIDDQLPLIAILHPTTGAVKFTWTGLISADELASRLVEFAASHTMDATPAPAAAPVAAPTPAAAPVASKEDIVRAPEKTYRPDYGPIPDEPAERDPEAIKISLKLPTKTIARRYRKSDPVRVLFAIALSAMPEERPFDLNSRYPALALGDRLDATLEGCNLAGSQVFHRWI